LGQATRYRAVPPSRFRSVRPLHHLRRAEETLVRTPAGRLFMLVRGMSNGRDPDEHWPPKTPDLPQTGEEILREVERLKREPARFGCLGMSFGMLLLVLILAWLVWRFVF